MIGCKSGRIRTGCIRLRPVRAGIDLFIEDGAYTTVAAAVTILVVLTLLFSSATAVWTMSRSGDVQASADATAMAGANVVSSYYTIATTVDAVVLSMGLTGFISVGAGLVGTLVPGMRAGATELVHSGVRVLQARNDLCASASRGLSRLEEGLPYLVAARGTRICGAQGRAATEYAGTALAVLGNPTRVFPRSRAQRSSWAAWRALQTRWARWRLRLKTLRKRAPAPRSEHGLQTAVEMA